MSGEHEHTADGKCPACRETMLDFLDEIRRRVDVGDVVGFALVANAKDGVLNRAAGEIEDAMFILVEEEIAAQHRFAFLEDFQKTDSDRRPALRPTEPE